MKGGPTKVSMNVGKKNNQKQKVELTKKGEKGNRKRKKKQKKKKHGQHL